MLPVLILAAVCCLSLAWSYPTGQQPPAAGAPAAAGMGQQTDGEQTEDAWVVLPRMKKIPRRNDSLRRADPAPELSAAPTSRVPAAQKTDAPRTRSTTRIRIDNADLISNNEDLAPGVQRLTGNVRFYHGNTLMTCDQAEFDRGRNTFFASGNVFVNEGDTLTLRSDRMLYTGDDQLIKSYGNVELVHKTTTLRTDTLDYDRRAQQAYYFDGGVITDDKNTLESQIGVYRTADDLADFYLDVHAWDPDYNLYSDTLRYYTRTKVIVVQGPTYIYGDKNRIYTELGQYDTRSGISDFYRGNRISYGRRTLLADTLHYDRPGGYARATSRVEIQDSVQRAAVYGDFAEYFERQDSVIFPRNPKAVQLLDRDTLYSRADTMMVTRRSSLVAYREALRSRADTLASDSLRKETPVASGRDDLRSALERFSDKGGERMAPLSAGGSASRSMGTKDISSSKDRTAIGPPDTLSVPADSSRHPELSAKQLRRAEKKRLRQEKRATQAAAAVAGRATGDSSVLPVVPEPADRSASLSGEPTVDTTGHPSVYDAPRTDSIAPALSVQTFDTLAGPGRTEAPDTSAWKHTVSDDSLRVMRSFHHVRFYKKDLAGAADSVFYDQKTGSAYLYGEPVVFSLQNQVTADTLYITRDLEKDVLDSLILVGNAFILSQNERDTALYNQVRGKTMRGKIIDNDLRVVNVRGNAQTLYYSYDSQGKPIGLNKSDASTMRVIMKDSKIQRVRFNKEPSGMMLAAGKDAPEEAQKLPGYVQRGSERPLSPQDIWGGEVHLDLGFAARPAGPSAAGDGDAETTDEQAGTWVSDSVSKVDPTAADGSAGNGETTDGQVETRVADPEAKEDFDTMDGSHEGGKDR